MAENLTFLKKIRGIYFILKQFQNNKILYTFIWKRVEKVSTHLPLASMLNPHSINKIKECKVMTW